MRSAPRTSSGSCTVDDAGTDARFVRGPTGVEPFGRVDPMRRELIIDADGMYREGFDSRTGVRAMALAPVRGELAIPTRRDFWRSSSWRVFTRTATRTRARSSSAAKGFAT